MRCECSMIFKPTFFQEVEGVWQDFFRSTGDSTYAIQLGLSLIVSLGNLVCRRKLEWCCYTGAYRIPSPSFIQFPRFRVNTRELNRHKCSSSVYSTCWVVGSRKILKRIQRHEDINQRQALDVGFLCIYPSSPFCLERIDSCIKEKAAKANNDLCSRKASTHSMC